MDISSFLGFPSTLAVDTVERSAEGLIVSLHATTSTVFKEVVTQGYTGSLRTIERIVAQFRSHGAKPVTKQTATLQKAPSPRNAALMIVRPPEKRTEAQTTFIDQLCKSDPKASTAYNLAQAFGSHLAQPGRETWIGEMESRRTDFGIAELREFMEGLADDAEAVVNGCTESWNNGMVEGFVNKVKWIKRSSYCLLPSHHDRHGVEGLVQPPTPCDIS